jgi:hypothetical protein
MITVLFPEGYSFVLNSLGRYDNTSNQYYHVAVITTARVLQIPSVFAAEHCIFSLKNGLTIHANPTKSSKC